MAGPAETITLRITPAEQGQRLDALAAAQSAVSRSQWGKHGEFWQAETPEALAPPRTKAKAGQVWHARCVPLPAAGDLLAPWATTLDVLAETDDYLVINKPLGVSVHPSASEGSAQTILNAVLHRYGATHAAGFTDEKKSENWRVGIVHRLDKTTTGCLIIARNQRTLAALQAGWKDYEKLYLAVVTGRTPTSGHIEAPIDRHPTKRTQMAVSQHPAARAAETSFRTIAQADGWSLLLVKLHTGRTHQIRVHLSSIGHPVLGDTLYGGPVAERIMLHSVRLRVVEPSTGTWVEFTAEPPAALEKYLEDVTAEDWVW